MPWRNSENLAGICPSVHAVKEYETTMGIGTRLKSISAPMPMSASATAFALNAGKYSTRIRNKHWVVPIQKWPSQF
jgi:hypothetical protein